MSGQETTTTQATCQSTNEKNKKRAKRNGDSTSTKTVACPNSLCGQVFASKQGVSNHYLHYSQCYKVWTGSAAFWQQRKEETNVAHAAPFTQPNLDSEDDAAQFDFDLEYPDAKPAAETEMDVGQCLDTGSFTNVHAVASQRGVNHTINDFVETKLLKILEDANVPHFLYQEILNWGCDAKSSGYGFEPTRTTMQAAIAHIERRFHLEHCQPTQVILSSPRTT
jgi:hypothetical protein